MKQELEPLSRQYPKSDIVKFDQTMLAYGFVVDKDRKNIMLEKKRILIDEEEYIQYTAVDAALVSPNVLRDENIVETNGTISVLVWVKKEFNTRFHGQTVIVGKRAELISMHAVSQEETDEKGVRMKVYYDVMVDDLSSLPRQKHIEIMSVTEFQNILERDIDSKRIVDEHTKKAWSNLRAQDTAEVTKPIIKRTRSQIIAKVAGVFPLLLSGIGLLK